MASREKAGKLRLSELSSSNNRCDSARDNLCLPTGHHIFISLGISSIRNSQSLPPKTINRDDDVDFIIMSNDRICAIFNNEITRGLSQEKEDFRTASEVSTIAPDADSTSDRSA